MNGHRDASGSHHPPAYWGLRWVWNHPEVICALSGMNDVAQVEANTGAAADALPGSLTESDHEMIGRVREVFERAIKINCTGCAYCMPCPYGVDIPYCLSAWNSQAMFGGVSAKFMYNFGLRAVGDKPAAIASMCRKCGVCETKCPQHLPIIKSLEETAKTMEGPVMKAGVAIVGKFLK
jgi:predicted aldo/keto reductase-like oxidoreductase